MNIVIADANSQRIVLPVGLMGPLPTPSKIPAPLAHCISSYAQPLISEPSVKEAGSPFTLTS